MAATPLTPTQISLAGITDTLTAANVDGHLISNPTGLMWIEVLNGSGAPITVTMHLNMLVDLVAVPDRTVTIAAGARRKIGVFPRNHYNDANGNVLITFSAVTTVTCGAFTL